MQSMWLASEPCHPGVVLRPATLCDLLVTPNFVSHLKPVLYCLDVKVSGWFTIFHTDFRTPNKEYKYVQSSPTAVVPESQTIRSSLEKNSNLMDMQKISRVKVSSRTLNPWTKKEMTDLGFGWLCARSPHICFDALNQLTIHCEALLSLKSKQGPLREERLGQWRISSAVLGLFTLMHGLMLTPATAVTLPVILCMVESDFSLVPGIVWRP